MRRCDTMVGIISNSNSPRNVDALLWMRRDKNFNVHDIVVLAIDNGNRIHKSVMKAQEKNESATAIARRAKLSVKYQSWKESLACYHSERACSR